MIDDVALEGPGPDAPGPDFVGHDLHRIADGIRPRRLMLRRDVFGTHPLYWTRRGDRVLAARSVARLRAGSGARCELDPAAAAAALCGTLPPDRSLFGGVQRVPPGHRLVVEDGRVRVEREAAIPTFDPAPTDASLEVLRADLRARLETAVARRVDPTRPATVLLSGGLDSTILLGIAARRGPTVAWTLSLRPDDPELERAREACRVVGVAQEVVTVTPRQLVDTAAAAIRACEEPIHDGLAVAKHWLASKLAGAGVRQALSGAGADEILAGHPAALAPPGGGPPRWAADWIADARLAHGLLTPEVAATVRPFAWERDPSVDPLVEAQRLACARTLPEATLPIEVRPGDALGVRVRLPYLDDGVVQLGSRLPLSLRTDGPVGKVLLRAAFPEVPHVVRDAAKVPQAAPPGESAESRAAWHALFADVLTPRRIADLGFLDPSAVTSLVERARTEADDPSRDRVLMRLLSLVVLSRPEA